MELSINYGNLGLSENIGTAVEKRTQHLKALVGEAEIDSLNVYFENENPLTSAGVPRYRCLLVLQSKFGTNIVEKKSKNFYRCLNQSFKAMERLSKKLKGKALKLSRKRVT